MGETILACICSFMLGAWVASVCSAEEVDSSSGKPDPLPKTIKHFPGANRSYRFADQCPYCQVEIKAAMHAMQSGKPHVMNYSISVEESRLACLYHQTNIRGYSGEDVDHVTTEEKDPHTTKHPEY